MGGEGGKSKCGAVAFDAGMGDRRGKESGALLCGVWGRMRSREWEKSLTAAVSEGRLEGR